MNDLLPYLPDQLNRALTSLPLFAPELYLTGLFLIILITDLLFGRNSAKMCRTVSALGMLVVIFKVLLQYGMTLNGPQFLFSDILLLQHTSVAFKLIVDVISFVLIIYFPMDDDLASHKKGLSDLYTITIAAVFGMHLMIMAANLLSMYVAVEMVSIASYLLVAYRAKGAGQEAGLKYVLFGAAASAVMLYGISLVYAYTGSFNIFFGNMITDLARTNPSLVFFALVLILAGIGFKLSFVPMQFWVPDVYQGASTPVTAWLSTVPKIAAFGLFTNFLYAFMFAKLPGIDLRLVISAIGIVTMIAGNFAAVMQRNVKRMLAYSSVGHTGFTLMALTSLSGNDASAVTFYLAAYAIANMGALMLVTYFKNNENAENIDEYRGFGFKYPVGSVCFVILLVSLTGLPVTAGFTGKLLVFSSAYNYYQHTGNVWLLAMMITGAATTVVSLFYYLRVPLNLFLRNVENQVDSATTGRPLLAIVLVLAIFIVVVGVFPSLISMFM